MTDPGLPVQDGHENRRSDQREVSGSAEPTLRDGFLRFDPEAALGAGIVNTDRNAPQDVLAALSRRVIAPPPPASPWQESPEPAAPEAAGIPGAGIPGAGTSKILPQISKRAPRKAAPVDISQELTLSQEVSQQQLREFARVGHRSDDPHDDFPVRSVDTHELIDPARQVHKPTQRPVRHSSQIADAGRLEGSSLPGPPVQMPIGVRQVSTVVLRLRVGHRLPGQTYSVHQAEYRAHIFHDMADIVRYSLYQDPNGCHGFINGENGASYSLMLSERFVVPSTSQAAAEIHVRYEGRVSMRGGGQVRFKGTLVVLGSGAVRPGRPHLEGPDGRAQFTAGCVTIGLW